MTEYIKKEDAIEALMGYFVPPIYTGRQVDQAKTIAETILYGTATVELEQEPSEDCISRDYMLRVQRELHGWMSNDKNHELWEKIKDAPSVVPSRATGKWIPVSERLPEKGQYVLASVREDYAEHNIAEHEVIICRCEEQSFWSNGIITAWQPLPDPYKESEEE